MDNFINALLNFEIDEILQKIEEINNHIKNGFLTVEDKIYLDYYFPLFNIGKRKVIKNGKIKKNY